MKLFFQLCLNAKNAYKNKIFHKILFLLWCKNLWNLMQFWKSYKSISNQAQSISYGLQYAYWNILLLHMMAALIFLNNSNIKFRFIWKHILFYVRALFLIDDAGIVRHICINDLPVGRSVDETFRLVQVIQWFPFEPLTFNYIWNI